MFEVPSSIQSSDRPLAQPDSAAATYQRVRDKSLSIAAGLTAEDSVVQSMPEASPIKWHLAHTTWFFEQFVLGRDANYRPLHEDWHYLLNSYYQSVGAMHARNLRGLLTRPSLAEVIEYRRRIDERMLSLLACTRDAECEAVIVLGMNHEQQHQELMLTDIKHLFSLNPLEPIYQVAQSIPPSSSTSVHFVRGAEGIVEIGHSAQNFAFDCETPRHQVLLHPHALANRLVTNTEFREFVQDGGYRTPTLWLSEGWNTVNARQWQRPMYWSDDLATEFTLAGRQPISDDSPVCHVSYFEADAFARWAGVRLPREEEWESMAATHQISGNFLESGYLHPIPAPGSDGMQQLFGDLWEWTASPYVSYPGYRPPPGALGEYNGKFMCGQYVLRGGSCATPISHIRASYRNFFAPQDRWQFMGFRLGKDR